MTLKNTSQIIADFLIFVKRFLSASMLKTRTNRRRLKHLTLKNTNQIIADFLIFVKRFLSASTTTEPRFSPHTAQLLLCNSKNKIRLARYFLLAKRYYITE